jgi:hypothetical protein
VPSESLETQGQRGCAEAVDIGHHRVSGGWAVHGGTLRCTTPLTAPPQWSVSAGLEGEVGEVVGSDPKTLLRWVWPQQADDDVVREASDEGLASRSPREDIEARRSGEGAPSDGLHRPSVDKAEGAKA